MEYGLDLLKRSLCYAQRNPGNSFFSEDDCHPTLTGLYSFTNNGWSLRLLEKTWQQLFLWVINCLSIFSLWQFSLISKFLEYEWDDNFDFDHKRLGRHIAKHGVYYIFFLFQVLCPLSLTLTLKYNLESVIFLVGWFIRQAGTISYTIFIYAINTKKKNDKFLVAVQPL